MVLALLVVAVGAAAIVRSRLHESPKPTATPPPPVPLTIPEGLRRTDIARLLDQRTRLSGAEYLRLTGPSAVGERLAGTSHPTSLEGFLFPATYEIGDRLTARDLVNAQLHAFSRRMAGVNLRYARARNLTRFDVLTIASMVEREVQVPSERAVVAGVIYNRLHLHMRLDIDATVQYAIGAWTPNLTAADLAVDSPYNTRRFPGLPPGPISNPGIASIQAAAHPRRTPYLYYVARNDGTGRHYFATTLRQFTADVARSRANAGR